MIPIDELPDPHDWGAELELGTATHTSGIKRIMVALRDDRGFELHGIMDRDSALVLAENLIRLAREIDITPEQAT